MDKIKFQKGGQPVFLDDLQLLQDNYIAIIEFIRQSVTGSKVPVLLEDFDPLLERIDESTGRVDVLVPANKLLYDGLVVDLEEGEVTDLELLAPIYVSFGLASSMSRVFQDGVSREVRIRATATLTKEKPARGFPMNELSRFTGIKAQRVFMYNGYKGYVRVTDTQLLVYIRTTLDQWEGGTTLLFTVTDNAWKAKLANGKFHIYEGSAAMLSFDEQGRCFLKNGISSIAPIQPPLEIKLVANL